LAHVEQWQGEIGDHSAAFGSLEATDGYEGRDETFPLPSRIDYTNAFRAAGDLGPEVELASEPMLAAAAQAHWHSAGPNSCVFASYLSERRSEYGWETFVITQIETGRDLASEIAEISRMRLREPEIEVVSVVMPELDDEPTLADALARLSGLTDWEVRNEGSENDENLGSIVRLGVRAAVEFDHWSEVLGFGRFAALPNTRLAPFTEFAIRAKPPKRPRRNQRAYMADIGVDVSGHEFKSWWKETEEERAKRLAGDQDLRGKAKVTCCLQEANWSAASP
jgi:hypothetical protein